MFIEIFDKISSAQIVVSNIDPKTGVVGEIIRFSGQNFYGIDSVTFADGISGDFSVISDKIMLVTVPNGAAFGDVTVTSTSRSTTGTYSSFYPFPNVTGFTPKTGTSGDVISIFGNAFSGITGVKVNNLDLESFAVVNNSTITGAIPSGNTKGNISVHGYFGISDVSVKEFIPQPSAITVSPSGDIKNAQVTINGLNFFSSNLSATPDGNYYYVGFGDVSRTGAFGIVDQFTLTGLIPLNGKSGNLYIFGVDGVKRSDFTFDVQNNSPTLSHVYPSTGVSNTRFSVSGNNIYDILGIELSGPINSTAQNIAWDSGNGNYVSFQTQTNLNPGYYTVTVTGKAGADLITNGIYILGSPTYTGFYPDTGAYNSSIILSGENFYNFSRVYINDTGNPVNVLSGTNNSVLYLKLPNIYETGAKFIVDNTVAPVTGDLFRYYLTPEITGFSPTSGTYNDDIVISGNNFDGVTGLRIGTKFVQEFSVIDRTGINFSLPYDVLDGKIQIRATGGNSSSFEIFNFLTTQPILSGFTPQTGYDGVTEITLSGIALNNVFSIEYSGNGTTLFDYSFSLSGNGFLYSTIPTNTTGGPIILVDQENRKSQSSDEISITEILVPYISGFYPMEGPSGTSFNISGSGILNVNQVFVNGSSVSFSHTTIGSVPVVNTSIPDINPFRQEITIKVSSPAGSHTSDERFLVYADDPHFYNTETLISTGWNYPSSGYERYIKKLGDASGAWVVKDPIGVEYVISTFVNI